MEQVLACVFLAGVNRHKYKTVLDDLNNDFVLGTVNYPEDIAGMMTQPTRWWSI
jgi:hypothetical protein